MRSRLHETLGCIEEITTLAILGQHLGILINLWRKCVLRVEHELGLALHSCFALHFLLIQSLHVVAPLLHQHVFAVLIDLGRECVPMFF